MPSFDAGQSGLTGTVGVTILTAAGAVHTARATAGITEPVAGSGVYFLAHPDPGTLLLFVFDGGVGTVGASVWDDGVQLAPKSTALSNATWTDTKAGYLDAAVSAIPTTPLLAASYTAPDNAGIAAILEDTGTTLPAAVAAIPTTPLLAASYTAPDNAGVAAIKAKTDNLPSDPADASVVAGQITDAQSAILTPLGVVDGILDGIAADYAKTGEAATAASPIAASLSAISASLPSRIDAQLAANHGNTQWGVLYTTAAPVSATLPAGTTVWTTRL